MRYSSGKIKFEILTKKGAVLKYRQNKLSLQNVLMVDAIFTKLSQGKVANSSDLKGAFGTTDFNDCVAKILAHGDLNSSSEERRAKVDNKRNEIIYYITQNYVNPLSSNASLPHSASRIAHCMDECKIRIDAQKSTKTQALNAIKKMSGKLFFAKANMMSVELTVKYKYDCNKIAMIMSKIAGGASFQQKFDANACTFSLEINKAELEEVCNALQKVTNGGDYDLCVVQQERKSNAGGNGTVLVAKRGGKVIASEESKRKKKKKRPRLNLI
mmetsp:Transcript_63227/g.100521  ORF Transcript_63227/g.100521 Transcript_63227/m.100521 type:complete len:271 (-) Transcript_63227:103-915(-)